MTRAEAEEKYLLCLSIVNVMGGDIIEACRQKGIPEEYINEFVGKQKSQGRVYDDFFKEHNDKGDLQLTEAETIAKLKNFGIKAGKDKNGDKWIVLGKRKDMNSVILNLCRHLQTSFGYKYYPQ
jgi:uncharacterized protein YecA (UPF0149 family)